MKPILTFTLVCVASIALHSQDLQEGTWSGSMVRVGGNNPRPQVQKISIEVKKVSDPHWAWRPGGGDVWTVMFVGGPNQGVRAQVTDLHVDNQSIAFSYKRQDLRTICRLNRQPDGNYEGECTGEDDPVRFRMTLLPPKASK